MKKILLLLSFTFFLFTKVLGQQTYAITKDLPLADIAGTGTQVTLTPTTTSGPVPIGFDFKFYGNTYTDLFINPTGTLSFGAGSTQKFTSYGEGLIGTGPNFKNFIAYAWMYQGLPNLSNTTFDYFTTGTSPNRIMVINVRGLPYTYSLPYPPNSAIAQFSIQIQLYEGENGKIELHCAANETNAFLTGQVGLEGPDGINNATASTYLVQYGVHNFKFTGKMVRFTSCPSIPRPTISAPQNKICDGKTIDLTSSDAPAGGTYYWYQYNPFNPAVTTKINNITMGEFFNNRTSIAYKVKTLLGACESAYSADFVVKTILPPTISTNIVSLTCTQPNAILKAEGNIGNGIYTWSIYQGAVIQTSSSDTYQTNQVNTTKYLVSYTENGCSNYSAAPFAILGGCANPPPVISATTPNSFCSGGTISLAATGCEAAEVNWPDGTHGLSWTSPVINNPNASTTISSTFTATCTISGATTGNSNTISASIYGNPPAPTISIDNTYVIAGATLNLTAANASGSYSYEWSWTDGTGPRTSNTNPLTVNPTESTTYNVVSKYNNCSSTTTSKAISVYPDSPVVTSTNATINSGQTATLQASGCAAPGVVSWYLSQGQGNYSQQSTMDPTFTTLPLTSNSGAALYKYAAICTRNGLASNYSNLFTITVNATPASIAISNTTPTAICGNSGSSFTVNYTTAGTFANTVFDVQLIRVYYAPTGESLEGTASQVTSTNDTATLTLGADLVGFSNGGYYYIKITNGSVKSAEYIVTDSKPAIPSVTVSGTIPITAIGQTVTLNTAPIAAIAKQWYSKKPGSSAVLISGEVGDNLTLAPESTSYYSVKYTNANQCAITSLENEIPVQFTLSGNGVPNETYTEGPVEYLCRNVYGTKSLGGTYTPFDAGTHYYYGNFNMISGQYSCDLTANFISRVNNVWGVYAYYTTASGSTITEHFVRKFHTKDPFPTIPGARVAATSTTNTIPPTSAVWINDVTGAELILTLAGATEQPLPVTLISFTGKQTAPNENTLNWKTANEKAFDRFEIQKSSPLTPSGGISTQKFEKIGAIKGSKSEVYEFIDQNPQTTTDNLNYYRLKMIDLDGSFSYSKIISIENDIEKNIVGNFYPNPIKGNEVFIDIQAVEAGNWAIKTYSQTGQLLNNATQNLQKGENKVKVDLGNGGFGTLYIQIESKGILAVRKLVKE